MWPFYQITHNLRLHERADFIENMENNVHESWVSLMTSFTIQIM